MDLEVPYFQTNLHGWESWNSKLNLVDFWYVLGVMTSYWPVWWGHCEVVLLYPKGGVWVAIHAFHHHHDSFLVCLSRLKFGTLRLGIWLVESRCSVYILRQPDYFRMGWNKPVGVLLRMAPLVTEDHIALIHSHILIGVGPNFGANYDLRLVKVPTEAISPSYPTSWLWKYQPFCWSQAITALASSLSWIIRANFGHLAMVRPDKHRSTRYLDTSNTEKPMHPIPALNSFKLPDLQAWAMRQKTTEFAHLFEEHHNSNSWYSWYSCIYVFSILIHD